MYHCDYSNLPKKIKASANDNLNYFLRSGTDQQINFVFHLSGKIDTVIMKKAIRLTIDAEPVLGCKYVKHKRRSYWERREDLDDLDYFEIIKSDNPEQDVKQFIISQIDPVVDSLLKIRLFRGKKDILVIKSDHSVMDGGGFYDYLTILCETYNRLLVDPNHQVSPNVNSSRELKQALKHFSFYKKIRSLILERGYTPKWSFPSIGIGNKEKTYTLRKIDADRFSKIKEYGKQHGSTLNDMFLTASFRALFELKKPNTKKKMTIAVPTDLRSIMPDKKADTIANLVSTTFVNLKYDPEATFDEVLREISKQMKKKKNIHLGLGLMFMINNLFRFRYVNVERVARRIYKGLYKKGKMHPIITNVGRIDNPKRNFGLVDIEDAYIITPINWAPSFSMGISSYNKRISLSIGYCEDSYDKRTIELFLDLFLKELPE